MAAVLSSGLFALPLVPLYCVGGDPVQAAECCRQAETCNRPGMKDDCCRSIPGGAPVATKAQLQAAGQLAVPAFTPVVLPVPTPVPALESAAFMPTWLTKALLDASPPPLSVLRV